jgi:DNA invertase Pin-like site-specific DNA recombinase
MTPAKQRQANRMYADKTPVSEIAAVLGVGRATIYRALNAADGAGTAS